VKHGPWPGNTSIIKIQDSLMGGGLATWGANQAIDRILAGRPWKQTSGEKIRSAAIDHVNRAQRIGTLVHEQVATILTGGRAEPTDETAPYVYAYSAFLAKERPEYLAVEQRVIHAKAAYGGTLDFIARLPRFPDHIVLGDIKTGKPKESHRLQLAGYMAAEGFGGEIDGYHRYWYDDDQPLLPIPKITKAALLYLRPDGYELVPVDVTRDDISHFLYLVGVYHRLRDWKESKPIGESVPRPAQEVAA
jgi:hypothetical protein